MHFCAHTVSRHYKWIQYYELQPETAGIFYTHVNELRGRVCYFGYRGTLVYCTASELEPSPMLPSESTAIGAHRQADMAFGF